MPQVWPHPLENTGNSRATDWFQRCHTTQLMLNSRHGPRCQNNLLITSFNEKHAKELGLSIREGTFYCSNRPLPCHMWEKFSSARLDLSTVSSRQLRSGGSTCSPTAGAGMRGPLWSLPTQTIPSFLDSVIFWGKVSQRDQKLMLPVGKWDKLLVLGICNKWAPRTRFLCCIL